MTYIITHLAGWILEILMKESFKDNAQYAEKQDYCTLYTLLLYRIVLNQNNSSTFQQNIFKPAEVTHLQSHCTHILLNVTANYL
jgi:hypothetical protein